MLENDRKELYSKREFIKDDKTTLACISSSIYFSKNNITMEEEQEVEVMLYDGMTENSVFWYDINNEEDREKTIKSLNTLINHLTELKTKLFIKND